ncbi:hypothetical protein ABPG74_001566 [Tetrahymena malaccensis]
MSTNKGNNSSKGIVYMRKNPPQQNQINQNQQNSNQLLQNENQDQVQGEKIASMYFNQQEKGQQIVQSSDSYFLNSNNQNPQSQNCQLSAERQGNIYKSSNGSNQINNQSQIQVKTRQKLSQTSIPFNNYENQQQRQNLQADLVKSKVESGQNENNLEQIEEQITCQPSSQNPKFSQPFLGIILLNANETSQEALKNVYFIVINQKEVKIQDHYEFTVSSQEDELQDMQDHFQVISQKIDYYFTKAEEGFIMSYASKQVKALLKQFKLQFLEHEINKEAIYIDQIIPEKYTKIQNKIQLNQLMEDLEMKQDATLKEKIKILSYFNNQFSTNLIMCILKIVSQGFFITQALSSGWRERNRYQTKINNYIRQIAQYNKVNDGPKDNPKNQQNKNQQIQKVIQQDSQTNLNKLEQKSDSASSQNILPAADPQIISNQEQNNELYLLNNQETQKLTNNNNNSIVADQAVIQSSTIKCPTSSDKDSQNFNQKIDPQLERQSPQQIQQQLNQQISDLSTNQNNSNLFNTKHDSHIQTNLQIQNNQQQQQIHESKMTQSIEKQNKSTNSQIQTSEENKILTTPISQDRAASQSIQLRSEIQNDLNLLKSGIESNQKKLDSSFLHNLNNGDQSNPYRSKQMTDQKEPAFENEDLDIIQEIKKEINETQQLSDSVTNLKDNLISQVSQQQQFLTKFVDQQTNTIQNLRQKQGVLFEFIVNLNQDTENLIQQQQQQLSTFLEDFNKQNCIQQELIMNEIKIQDNKFKNHLQSLENLANRVQYSQEAKQSEIQQQQQAMQEASRLLLDCSQALLHRNPMSISQIRESIYQQSFLNKSVSQINDQTPSQVFNGPSFINSGYNQYQSHIKQSNKHSHSDNEQCDKEKMNNSNDKIERSQKDFLSSSFQSQKNQSQIIHESNFQQKNLQNNLEQNRLQQNIKQHELLNSISNINQKNQTNNPTRENNQKQIENFNQSEKAQQIEQKQINSQKIENNQQQIVVNSTKSFNTQKITPEAQQLDVSDNSKTQGQQNKITCQQQQTNNQEKINQNSDQINKINEINNYIQNMNTPNSDTLESNYNNQQNKSDKISVQGQINNQAKQQDQATVVNRKSQGQQNKKQNQYEKKESEQQQKQLPQIENKITNSFQQNQYSKLQKNSQNPQQNQQFQQREDEQKQNFKQDNQKKNTNVDSSKNLFIDTKNNNTNLNQSSIQSSDISFQINTIMTKPSTSELSISNIKSTENLADENISSAKRKKKMLLKQKINQNIEPFQTNEEILKEIQILQEKAKFNGLDTNFERQNQGDSTESSAIKQKDNLDVNERESKSINLSGDVVENKNLSDAILQNKNIQNSQPENKNVSRETQNNQNSNQAFQSKNLSQFIEEQQRKRKESIKDLQESFQSSNNSSQIIKSDNLILQSELFEVPKKSIFEGNSFMLAIYQQTLEAEKRADQNKNNCKQTLNYPESKKIAQVQEIKQKLDKIENSQKKIRKQQSQTDHEEYKKSVASSKEDENNTQYQLMKNFAEENMGVIEDSEVKNQFIQNDKQLLRQNLQDKKQDEYEKFEDNSNTSQRELNEDDDDDDQNEEFEEEQQELSNELKQERSKSNHSDEVEDNYSGIKEAQSEQQVISPQDKVQKQFLKPPSSTQSLQSCPSKQQLPPLQNAPSSSTLQTQQNLGSQQERNGQPAIQLTGFEKSTLSVYKQIQEKQNDCSSSQYTLQKIYNGGQNTFSNYSKHNNKNSNRNKSTERSFSQNKNKIQNGNTNTSNQSYHHSNMRHNNYKENQGYTNNKNSKQYTRSQSSQEHYWRAPQVEYIDKRQLTTQLNQQRKMSDHVNSSNLVFDSQSLQVGVQQAQKVKTSSYPYSNDKIDEEEKLNSSIISRQTEVEYNNIYDLIKPRNRMSPKEISQTLKKNTEEVQQRLNKWKEQEEQLYYLNTSNLQNTNDQTSSDVRKKKLTKSTVQMLIVLIFQPNQQRTEIVEINSVIVNTDRYQTIDEFNSRVKQIDTRISCDKDNNSYNVLKQKKIPQTFEDVFAKLCNFLKPYLDNYKCCILYDQQHDAEILYNQFINKKIIPNPTVLEIFYTCIFLADIFPSSLNTKSMPVKNYNQAMTLLKLKKYLTKKLKVVEIKNFENVVITLLNKGVIISSKDIKCAFSLDQREKKVQQFITNCMECFEQNQYFLILEFQHGKYDAYNQIENCAIHIQILQKTPGFSFIHIQGMYGFSYDFYRNDISAFHFFFQSYLNALKINQNQLSLFVLEEDNILANQVIELMFPVNKKPQKIVLFKEVQAQIWYNLEHILQKNVFSFDFEQLFSTLCGQSYLNNQTMLQM